MRQMLAEQLLTPEEGDWGSSGPGRKEGTSPVIGLASTQVFTAPISLLASGTCDLGRAGVFGDKPAVLSGPLRPTSYFSSYSQSLASWLSQPAFPVSISHIPESKEANQAQKGPKHYTEGAEYSVVDPA